MNAIIGCGFSNGVLDGDRVIAKLLQTLTIAARCRHHRRQHIGVGFDYLAGFDGFRGCGPPIHQLGTGGNDHHFGAAEHLDLEQTGR
jgi:hypothetical protein